MVMRRLAYGGSYVRSTVMKYGLFDQFCSFNQLNSKLVFCFSLLTPVVMPTRYVDEAVCHLRLHVATTEDQ